MWSCSYSVSSNAIPESGGGGFKSFSGAKGTVVLHCIGWCCIIEVNSLFIYLSSSCLFIGVIKQSLSSANIEPITNNMNLETLKKNLHLYSVESFPVETTFSKTFHVKVKVKIYRSSS